MSSICCHYSLKQITIRVFNLITIYHLRTIFDNILIHIIIIAVFIMVINRRVSSQVWPPLAARDVWLQRSSRRDRADDGGSNTRTLFSLTGTSFYATLGEGLCVERWGCWQRARARPRQ